jgi:hypothetical protein
MSVLHKPNPIFREAIEENIAVIRVSGHNLFVERGFQVRILGGLDVPVDLLYVNPIVSTIPCIGHLLLLECEGRNKQKGSPAPGSAFHALFVLSAHILLTLRVSTALSSHIGVSFSVLGIRIYGETPRIIYVLCSKISPCHKLLNRNEIGEK